MKPENSDLTDKNEIKEYESKWGGGEVLWKPEC